jgi:hypothetical protein
MPVLDVDLHSFTKNISIIPPNDADHFPKTPPCFPEIISIISKTDAEKCPAFVKLT